MAVINEEGTTENANSW